MAKEKRFDVIVAGYAGYDLAVSPVPQNIMDVDTGTAPQRIITVGGDGINAATSFASLGCKTALCSAVGRDMFAKTVRNHLKEHNIDARYVFDVDAPTTFTLILVGEDGERHCLIRRGATESICRDMVPAEAIENARHLHYASFFPMTRLDPEAHLLLRQAKEAGLSTSMDAVTYHGDKDPLELLAPSLPYVDIFMPSFGDAALIFKTRDFAEMKRQMSRFGTKFFCVKCGANGLLATDFTRDVHIPAMCRGAVVDTTGAGDSCAAGFAAAYLRGGDLAACAAIASANAAFVVQSFGATTGCRPYEDVAALAKSFGYDVP